MPTLGHVSVKEAVLPFDRFPGVDTLLGPEMRSTGEVMGVDVTFGLAFAKSQLAAGTRLPDSGTVFLSLADRDKPTGLEVARLFADLGFSIAATLGTAGFLRAAGLEVDTLVAKVGEEGVASDAVELIAQGKVQLVVNTPAAARAPGRRAAHPHATALAYHVPCLTTLAAARAAVGGMAEARAHPLVVRTLQDLHLRHGAAGDEPGGPLRIWPPGGIGEPAQSGHDGVGHLGPRGRAGRLRRSVGTGRGGGEVALRAAMGGQPGAAGARGRGQHAQQRRLAGAGPGRVDRAGPAGVDGGRGTGGAEHLGPVGR